MWRSMGGEGQKITEKDKQNFDDEVVVYIMRVQIRHPPIPRLVQDAKAPKDLCFPSLPFIQPL